MGLPTVNFHLRIEDKAGGLSVKPNLVLSSETLSKGGLLPMGRFCIPQGTASTATGINEFRYSKGQSAHEVRKEELESQKGPGCVFHRQVIKGGGP